VIILTVEIEIKQNLNNSKNVVENGISYADYVNIAKREDILEDWISEDDFF
jgi:hypothetical protein